MFHVCDLPEVYRNYFTVNKSVHSYDTRQSNDLHIHYNYQEINWPKNCSAYWKYFVEFCTTSS